MPWSLLHTVHDEVVVNVGNSDLYERVVAGLTNEEIDALVEKMINAKIATLRRYFAVQIDYDGNPTTAGSAASFCNTTGLSMDITAGPKRTWLPWDRE
jgi:hypothetical protein